MMDIITIPVAYAALAVGYILGATVAILVLSRAYWRELSKRAAFERRIWAAQDALRGE